MEAQDERKDLNFSQFQFLLYIFNGLIDVDKNISPSSGNGRKSFFCNFLMFGKQKLRPDDKKAFFAVSSWLIMLNSGPEKFLLPEFVIDLDL